jgi:hypothetical protein
VLINGAIRSSHVQQLRTALNDAIGTILSRSLAFTYAANLGDVVHAKDVQEIRDGVK